MHYCLCRVPDFLKNILICVSKMNEGLTGLERHELSFFWVNYPFNQPRYQHKNSLIWKWNNNFPFFSSLDCSVWAFERLVSKATSLKDSLRYKLQCKHFRHLEGKTDDLYALICCALPVPSVLPSWAIILPPSLTHLTPTIWLAFIDYDTKAPGSTYKWTRH